MYKVIQQGLLITSNYHPWGETIVYARMELFLWHLIFQFHPKGHLCFLTDNISQLEPATVSYNDSIAMSNLIHIFEAC